jgi:hypothetical protein
MFSRTGSVATYALPTFQYAIVESFDTDTMKGTLRLNDATVLPFDYLNWVEPALRKSTNDGTRYAGYDLVGADHSSGSTEFSWPARSSAIMVLIDEDTVQFWTWPNLVLTVDIAQGSPVLVRYVFTGRH